MLVIGLDVDPGVDFDEESLSVNFGAWVGLFLPLLSGRDAHHGDTVLSIV